MICIYTLLIGCFSTFYYIIRHPFSENFSISGNPCLSAVKKGEGPLYQRVTFAQFLKPAALVSRILTLSYSSFGRGYACVSMLTSETESGLTSAFFSQARLLQRSSMMIPRNHSSTANAIQMPSSPNPK